MTKQNDSVFNSENHESVSSLSQNKIAWGDASKSLPIFITLRSGGTFDPRLDHWAFADGVSYLSMNFEKLPSQVELLIHNLKLVLIQALEINSPIYSNNLFRTFCRIAAVIAETTSEKVAEIDEIHVANYISKYSVSDKQGMESQLSALLNRWAGMHLEGVSRNATQLLNKRKKKGNTKGEAVLTLDPVTGPLTEYELQHLTTELNSAYSSGILDKLYFFMAWLAIMTGQRVSQYCALKVKDLVRKENESGEICYEIMIPTAKQRGESTRDSFLCRPLIRQFGDALWDYTLQVKQAYPEHAENAAMFPSDRKHRIGFQLNDNFQGHWNATEMSHEFQKALSSISPVTARTMEPMNLAIGRFRDTIGTRAAQEGFGELVIAEILGHSDTQNVGVYTAAIPDIAERLDGELSDGLMPIANAFLGRILVTPEDATHAFDFSTQIIDYRNTKKAVGNCGTKLDCQFNAPIACYTCRNFEAWLDAPHDELLRNLVSERERLLTTSGPRVAAINDLTIDSIRAVIKECSRIKQSITFEEVSE